MILLQLFWSFFQIGLFSFGGGFASLPLIQNQVVSIHNWMTVNEFIDLITISQMTPGPIAINSATFIGIRIAGIPGALISTFGCILPSCIVVSILAFLYFKYQDLEVMKGILGALRPTIVSLIATSGVSIFVMAIWGENGFSLSPNDINIIALILFIGSLFILRKWKVNPIYVMMGSGVVGGILYLLL